MSNELKQLENKLKKNIGIQKHAEKVRKYTKYYKYPRNERKNVFDVVDFDPNKDSEMIGTSKCSSEPQFCERF